MVSVTNVWRKDCVDGIKLLKEVTLKERAFVTFYLVWMLLVGRLMGAPFLENSRLKSDPLRLLL